MMTIANDTARIKANSPADAFVIGVSKVPTRFGRQGLVTTPGARVPPFLLKHSSNASPVFLNTLDVLTDPMPCEAGCRVDTIAL